jgi:hypothetical protein
VNLGHIRITEEDLDRGEEQYSAELLTNVGFEIRDVFPDAADVLYEFIGANYRLTEDDLRSILIRRVEQERLDELIKFLLWYGFLGVLRDDDVAYIYSVKFDIRRLFALIRNRQVGESIFEINQAFWNALEVKHQANALSHS